MKKNYIPTQTMVISMMGLTVLCGSAPTPAPSPKGTVGAIQFTENGQW